MLWWPFLVFYGDVIFALVAALSPTTSGDTDSPALLDHSTFFKDVDFMFPENFLLRYPQESNPFRLKIFAYLIFNLLVKGYGTVDPSRFWSNYNRDDFNRAAIDAVFYEYLTHFKDRETKDFVFNPLENSESKHSEPVSNEEIAVDRIGQYLDLLSETKSQTKIKDACNILSKTKEYRTMSKLQTTDCDLLTFIQTSGIPGIDYPNFCDIPKTSFSCAGKRIPGIYADYETGCQAFHVCWLHRKDSFLCPIGTIFNQSLLTCDIWQDTSCFSSPLFHDDQLLINDISTSLDIPKYDGSCESLLTEPLRLHLKFPPASCEVKDVLGRSVKPREKDTGELMARLEKTYNLLKEMLQMLVKMRSELDKRNSRTSQINVLAKHLSSISSLSTEAGEASEFTRKLGETDLKAPNDAEQESHPGKIAYKTKPGPVISGTFLKTRKSSKEHKKNPRKRDVPEIIMRSLSLGGTFLNEGIIPLAKQVMMDSYRKIELKKR